MTTGKELFEKVVKKIVYRQGKRVKKKVSDREGYRVVDGKEEKISQKERRTRKLAQRKGAKKRKAKKTQAYRQLKQTLRKKKK